MDISVKLCAYTYNYVKPSLYVYLMYEISKCLGLGYTHLHNTIHMYVSVFYIIDWYTSHCRPVVSHMFMMHFITKGNNNGRCCVYKNPNGSNSTEH